MKLACRNIVTGILFVTVNMVAIQTTVRAGTVVASQDTWVHERDGENHGTKEFVNIKRDNNHDRVGYFEFDLSAYQGQTLVSARMTLHALGDESDDAEGNSMDLYLLGLKPQFAGTWSETVITGGSHPAESGIDTTAINKPLDFSTLWIGTGDAAGETPDPMVQEAITVPAEGVNVELQDIGAGDQDFVDFLNVAKEENDGLVTILAWTPTEANNTWLGVASSENTGGFTPPTLNVAVPEPASIALVGIGGLMMMIRRRN